MSMQSHLVELEKKHRALEDQLSDAQAHPGSDGQKIVEIKRQKLHIKDEIARLRSVH